MKPGELSKGICVQKKKKVSGALKLMYTHTASVKWNFAFTSYVAITFCFVFSVLSL